MNLDKEFDKRIATIHGLDHLNTEGGNTQEDTIDVRHAEFQAMADVFLGESFDRRKLERVENLQIALHEQQAVLYQRYEAKELSPEGYVESFNAILDTTFMQCKQILGEENFLKLFGAPRSERAGCIDKETFLQAHQTRMSQPALEEQRPAAMNPKAIEYFKDWSNYLLVTTVAALGWVATKDLPFFSPWMRLLCMVSLGLSVVFGIFTLALIPIIAEQQATNQSFYEVPAPFTLFSIKKSLRVKSVCFPQHVLFIIGIVLYVAGTYWYQKP